MGRVTTVVPRRRGLSTEENVSSRALATIRGGGGTGHSMDFGDARRARPATRLRFFCGWRRSCGPPQSVSGFSSDYGAGGRGFPIAGGLTSVSLRRAVPEKAVNRGPKATTGLTWFLRVIPTDSAPSWSAIRGSGGLICGGYLVARWSHRRGGVGSPAVRAFGLIKGLQGVLAAGLAHFVADFLGAVARDDIR